MATISPEQQKIEMSQRDSGVSHLPQAIAIQRSLQSDRSSDSEACWAGAEALSVQSLGSDSGVMVQGYTPHNGSGHSVVSNQSTSSNGSVLALATQCGPDFSDMSSLAMEVAQPTVRVFREDPHAMREKRKDDCWRFIRKGFAILVIVGLGSIVGALVVNMLTQKDDENVPSLSPTQSPTNAFLCLQNVYIDEAFMNTESSNCHIVGGDVTISSSLEGNFKMQSHLPNLRVVEGNLEISGTSLTSFVVDASGSGSSRHLLYASGIEIRGKVNIENNSNLLKVDLSKIVMIGGALQMNRNGNLNEVALAPLQSFLVGFIVIDKSSSLNFCSDTLCFSTESLAEADDYSLQVRDSIEIDGDIVYENPFKIENCVIYSTSGSCSEYATLPPTSRPSGGPTVRPTGGPTVRPTTSIAPNPTTAAPTSAMCDNTCEYSNDEECDDGGPGSDYGTCQYGTDCDDCCNFGGWTDPAERPECNICSVQNHWHLISDVLDVMKISHCTKIGGSLLIREGFVGELSLPLLEEIEGDSRYDDSSIYIKEVSQITRVNFPALVNMQDGIEISQNNHLEEIHMPLLRTVVGFIQIDNNPLLGELEFPELTTVNGYLTVGGNQRLAFLNVSKVHSIYGDMFISSNEILRHAYFNELKTVDGDLDFWFNDKLDNAVALPKLEEVGGTLEFYSCDVLSSVSLPALQTVGGDLIVEINHGMVSFNASLLVSVGGDVAFENNFGMERINLRNLQQIGGSRFAIQLQPSLREVILNEGLNTEGLEVMVQSLAPTAAPTVEPLI